MDVFTKGEDLRRHLEQWRKSGLRIGFVPTMGNLHAGHYSLLVLARQHADKVVASVFVNPTQFGPNEDYQRYPRTLEQDREGLAAHGCNALFAPEVAEIYPYGVSSSVRIDVPVINDILEGAVRPGHFAGVATVVTKLFHWVMPDVAVFGQKDFQQCWLIQRMTADLSLPIEIISGPTLREANGLAMSSRNQYLSNDERQRAGVIHQTLCTMLDQLRAGVDYASIEANALTLLTNAGFVVDYAVIRRTADLTEPTVGERRGLIALIAARLGATRLIDNLIGPI